MAEAPHAQIKIFLERVRHKAICFLTQETLQDAGFLSY